MLMEIEIDCPGVFHSIGSSSSVPVEPLSRRAAPLCHRPSPFGSVVDCYHPRSRYRVFNGTVHIRAGQKLIEQSMWFAPFRI